MVKVAREGEHEPLVQPLLVEVKGLFEGGEGAREHRWAGEDGGCEEAVGLLGALVGHGGLRSGLEGGFVGLRGGGCGCCCVAAGLDGKAEETGGADCVA